MTTLFRPFSRGAAALTAAVAVTALAFALGAPALGAPGFSAARPAGSPGSLRPTAPGRVLTGPTRRAGLVHTAATAAAAITRVAGTTRFDTAAQIAQSNPNPTANAILANGFTPADALAGAYLAGFLNAPVLLTGVTTTPPETLSALSKLQVQNLYVLGGPVAVSDAQVAALGQITSTSNAGGHLNVTRLAGADRYATAETVDATPPASHVGVVGGQTTALVANGLTFPDALAGGALAAGAALPMVLTDGKQLSPAAALTLTNLSVKQVEILGGTNAVSSAVESSIVAMGLTVHRIAGADRTETALDIAAFAGAQLGFTAAANCTTDPSTGGTLCAFGTLDVARGDNGGGGVDALALGPLAGRSKAPILLAATPDDPSTSLYGEVSLSAGLGVLQAVNIFGGPAAVSPGNAAFLTVAAGGGAHPTYNATPTTVARGGVVSVDDGGNPCPTAPGGTDGFNVAVLIPLGNAAPPTVAPSTTSTSTTAASSTTSTTLGASGQQTIDVFSAPAPLAGGPWAGSITVPSSTQPGSYALFTSCVADFAPGDTTKYSYQDYSPVMLTIT